MNKNKLYSHKKFDKVRTPKHPSSRWPVTLALVLGQIPPPPSHYSQDQPPSPPSGEGPTLGEGAELPLAVQSPRPCSISALTEQVVDTLDQHMGQRPPVPEPSQQDSTSTDAKGLAQL